jgi:3-oxoacyl-(acyl-carrier-protein) synthase
MQRGVPGRGTVDWEGIMGALGDAGYGPQDVVYVNAHGTSTPLNDRAETLAIKAALGDHATRRVGGDEPPAHRRPRGGVEVKPSVMWASR